MINYTGIDVSMQTLKVFDGNTEYEVPNEIGLKSLSEHLKSVYGKNWKKVFLIYEPTGPYSNFLREFAMKNGIKVYEINPKKSSNFSKAVGNRSKTDSIDARLLYEFRILLNESDFSVPSIDEVTEKLSSFLRDYRFIQKTKTLISNHIHSQGFLNKKSSNSITGCIEKELKRINEMKSLLEDEMKAYTMSREEIREDFENLLSIKGIGVTSAILLLYIFRKYPDTNRSQITSLCGLDPVKKTSGSSLNKREKISKEGNPLVRHMLYFPVMCAIQYNDRIKAYYTHLIDEHKPGKVALIACMRKLILIAHEIYVKKEKYRPLYNDKKVCFAS